MMNPDMSGNKINALTSHYSSLNETATQVVDGVPLSAASLIPEKVNVVSPSELPGGYQLTVIAENRALIVSVVS